MSDTADFLERTVQALVDAEARSIRVMWRRPQQADRCWACDYAIEIEGSATIRRTIFGEDGVQALQLAMAMAASEIRHAWPDAYWLEPGDNLGLPMLPERRVPWV